MMLKMWDKRLKETMILCLIAFGLLIISYFVFFHSSEPSASVSQNETMSETECRLCSILAQMEGVGKIIAYVNENDTGEVSGVVLVFEGANSISVRLDVLEATARALGISQNNISIYEMNG